MTKMLNLGILAVLVAGMAGACATPQAVENADTPAEYLFERAEVRFDRSDYKGAIERYNRVRNDHPYSKYAVRADLRIADAYYEQSKWSTAAEQYRTFVKLHPKHPRVDYARFRVGKSLFGKMPDNWFFLPPAHERDLSSTRTAARELKAFVKSYPESEYVEEARKMLRKSRRRLADHEMYVADFHMNRDNHRGAKSRLKGLLKDYSGLGLDAKALYMLAVSHLELDEPQKAKAALEDLVEFHPDTKYAERAKNYMARYNGDTDGSDSG